MQTLRPAPQKNTPCLPFQTPHHNVPLFDDAHHLYSSPASLKMNKSNKNAKKKHTTAGIR